MRSLQFVLAAATLCFVCGEVTGAELLQGSWGGRGYVKPSDGERQTVNCRVTYTPHGSNVVAVSATCSSETTTIHQTGQLSMVRPNRYVGDFHNSEYDISGRIQVSVSGSSQTVTFSSPRGSGSLSLSRR